MKIINPGSHFNLTGESEELSPLSLSRSQARGAGHSTPFDISPSFLRDLSSGAPPIIAPLRQRDGQKRAGQGSNLTRAKVAYLLYIATPLSI